MSRLARRPLTWLLLGASVATAVGLAFWPSDLPIHNDEYLPLLPAAWLWKSAEARGGLVESYAENVLGFTLPLRAYAHVGAVKGYTYWLTGLSPEVVRYRSFNLALGALAYGLFTWLAWRLAGRRALAALACLAWLAADTSLLTLIVTDEGPIAISLVAGAALALASFGMGLGFSWLRLAGIALLVFVGVWDRVNFLWLVAAAVVAGSVAPLAIVPRAAPRAILGTLLGAAAGLGGVGLLVPDYGIKVAEGAARSLSLLDWSAWLEHAAMLLNVTDPLSAFHRYVVTSVTAAAPEYVVYRSVFTGLTLAAVVVGLAGAIRPAANPERRRASLFLTLWVVVTAAAMVKTDESWAFHHVALLKPFVYVLAAVLAATSRYRARELIAASAVLALAAGLLGWRARRQVAAAEPHRGIYSVGWNAVEGWRAAVASGVPLVWSLDWGVFYPGIAHSRPSQRWERGHGDSFGALWNLTHGQVDQPVGLLLRNAGRHKWVLQSSEEHRVVSIERLDAHADDAWSFAVVEILGRSRPKRHPGSLFPGAWRYEEWEYAPHAAARLTSPCAGAHPCAMLSHATPAVTRLVRRISLEPDATYEISAELRAVGANPRVAGARLVVTEGSRRFASPDLRGTTPWHAARVHVATGPRAVAVEVSVYLGDPGHPTTGAVLVYDVAAVRLANVPDHLTVHRLGG